MYEKLEARAIELEDEFLENTLPANRLGNVFNGWNLIKAGGIGAQGFGNSYSRHAGPPGGASVKRIKKLSDKDKDKEKIYSPFFMEEKNKR